MRARSRLLTSLLDLESEMVYEMDCERTIDVELLRCSSWIDREH